MSMVTGVENDGRIWQPTMQKIQDLTPRMCSPDNVTPNEGCYVAVPVEQTTNKTRRVGYRRLVTIQIDKEDFIASILIETVLYYNRFVSKTVTNVSDELA
jgi:hypothetical protein